MYDLKQSEEKYHVLEFCWLIYLGDDDDDFYPQLFL